MLSTDSGSGLSGFVWLPVLGGDVFKGFDGHFLPAELVVGIDANEYAAAPLIQHGAQGFCPARRHVIADARQQAALLAAGRCQGIVQAANGVS